MDDLVTVATYSSPEEAYIVKGMLESNGVPAIVVNDDNLYVPVFNGVRVQVNASDASKAEALLSQNG
ncbi:MAG: DUF2007 domain-containing protein [Bacteroidales bacterium]|nr:DUF2007 domain-containing protein [Bacteroidales bacterium]MBD5258228.1 DUF2007 domain-containing protein [Barnesiella sp.]